jgi:hypothetical protein
LQININKCTFYHARFNEMYLQMMLDITRCKIGCLPCTYLGFPHSVRNPRRAECQCFIDKISSKLKPWRGKQMSRKARLTLVNSVFTTTLTYFHSVFDPQTGSTRRWIELEEISFGVGRIFLGTNVLVS